MTAAWVRLFGVAGALVTLAAVIAVLVWTLPAVEAPFAGFRYYDNGTVARVLQYEWTGRAAGVAFGDRVRAYDGHAWRGAAALDAYIAAQAVGRPIAYEVERLGPDGRWQARTLRVPTQPFSARDWTATTFTWWIVGVLSLGVAWLLVVACPLEPVALVHAGLCLTFGLLMAVVSPDATIAHRFLGHGTMLQATALLGYAALLAALVFPRAVPGCRAWLALATAAWAAAASAVAALGPRPDVELPIFLGAILASTLYLVRVALSALSPAGSALHRSQARWIGLGLFITSACQAVPMLAEQAGRPLPGAWSLTFASVAFPLGVAIACVRHRLVDLERFARPATLHALVGAMLALTYVACAGALQSVLGDQRELQAVLVAAVLTLVFGPVRDHTRGWLDRTFFRLPYDTPALATALNRQARQTLDPGALRAAYLDALVAALAPRWATLADADGRPLAGLSRGAPPALPAGAALPHAEATPADDALVLPLAADGPVFGLLALGPKRSGLPYTRDDRALVTTLGHQLALWLDLLERMHRELAQRRRIEALEQEERMHAEFLNLVSHELRTPVSAVLQALELGESEPDPARRRTYDQRMRRNMDALTILLDDLLQAGRLQLGGFTLHATEVDPGQLVHDVADQLAPLAARRDVTLLVEADGAVDPIWADPHRVAQVWRNLIHNAIKYGPAGGTVRVTLAREGDRLRGAVHDEGPGIAEAERPSLFQRFRPGAAGARAGGVGLGLYICDALVRAHGGEIGLASGPVGGTTFWFTLPA